MYVFNRITVNPQLPKRINKLSEISYNLWWSWNTEFLRLFKKIDIDLWERVEKNPVKFLREVDQQKLEKVTEDQEFLKEYDKIYTIMDEQGVNGVTTYLDEHPNTRELLKDFIHF